LLLLLRGSNSKLCDNVEQQNDKGTCGLILISVYHSLSLFFLPRRSKIETRQKMLLFVLSAFEKSRQRFVSACCYLPICRGPAVSCSVDLYDKSATEVCLKLC